jgi:hypothetical protein
MEQKAQSSGRKFVLEMIVGLVATSSFYLVLRLGEDRLLERGVLSQRYSGLLVFPVVKVLEY